MPHTEQAFLERYRALRGRSADDPAANAHGAPSSAPQSTHPAEPLQAQRPGAEAAFLAAYRGVRGTLPPEGEPPIQGDVFSMPIAPPPSAVESGPEGRRYVAAPIDRIAAARLKFQERLRLALTAGWDRATATSYAAEEIEEL